MIVRSMLFSTYNFDDEPHRSEYPKIQSMRIAYIKKPRPSEAPDVCNLITNFTELKRRDNNKKNHSCDLANCSSLAIFQKGRSSLSSASGPGMSPDSSGGGGSGGAAASPRSPLDSRKVNVSATTSVIYFVTPF
jgi:hypothetical protein